MDRRIGRGECKRLAIFVRRVGVILCGKRSVAGDLQLLRLILLLFALSARRGGRGCEHDHQGEKF